MSKKELFRVFTLFLFLVFIVSSCTLANPVNPNNSKPEENKETFETSFVSDFSDDISLPSSLRVIRGQTFVNHPQTKTAEGVISLVGKADIDTLIIFFEESMLNAGWIKEYSARPGAKAMFVFYKENRKSLINIVSMRSEIYATIWLYIGNNVPAK